MCWELGNNPPITFLPDTSGHTDHEQGCQIFLGAWHQNRKNVQNEHTMYQMFPNVHKIIQKDIKYINILQSETLKIFPKLRFLVWKRTIWQPWSWAALQLRLISKKRYRLYRMTSPSKAEKDNLWNKGQSLRLHLLQKNVKARPNMRRQHRKR
jgi:hypothetical protein